MKRFIAFIMAAVLLLCAVSCGEAGDPTDTATEKTAETQPESGAGNENPNDLEIDFKY